MVLLSRPPRICSMAVTSVQIVQLILGCTSVVLVYYYKVNKRITFYGNTKMQEKK